MYLFQGFHYDEIQQWGVAFWVFRIRPCLISFGDKNQPGILKVTMQHGLDTSEYMLPYCSSVHLKDVGQHSAAEFRESASYNGSDGGKHVDLRTPARHPTVYGPTSAYIGRCGDYNSIGPTVRARPDMETCGEHTSSKIGTCGSGRPVVTVSSRLARNVTCSKIGISRPGRQ